MIPANQLKIGSVLHENNDFLKVVSFESVGTAQSGRSIKLKLRSLTKGGIFDANYKAEQMVPEVDLNSARMEFLYADGDHLVLMDSRTFEQVSVPSKSLGNGLFFLKPNMELQVQFHEGRPIHILFPQSVEVKVSSAPSGSRQNDSNFKEVELENGMKILAPQFIKEGDQVIIEVETGRYVDRVKKEK